MSHTQLGHESILSLISYRFGLGSLVKRDAKANNIGQTFDWSSTVVRAARPSRSEHGRFGPLRARWRLGASSPPSSPSPTRAT